MGGRDEFLDVGTSLILLRHAALFLKVLGPLQNLSHDLRHTVAAQGGQVVDELDELSQRSGRTRLELVSGEWLVGLVSGEW